MFGFNHIKTGLKELPKVLPGSCSSNGKSRVGGWIRRQAGFVITVEFVLFTTILCIGLLVGISAIRDAMFIRYVKKQSEELWVFDSDGVVLGKAFDMDEHEAPRIPYIDRSLPPALPDPGHRNFRAMIGVRDDRFTGRQRIFYQGANCTGTPCITTPSAENVDSIGIDGLDDTGSVGYIYALQGTPTYGIGAGVGPAPRLPGFLYRESAQSCDALLVESAWTSQKVISGEPCDAFTFPALTGAVQCQGNFGGGSCDLATPPLPACIDLSPDIPSCGCPTGWHRASTAGEGRCCPPGSVGISGGQCGRDLSNLKQADSVPHPDDPLMNALEPLVAPFFVNLPIDTSTFQSVAPDGVEGEPGDPANVLYPVFTPPDGVEGN